MEIDKSKEEIIKDEIMEAAEQLFRKYGLNKTTMEDIAKASGKGKSTLYYYYSSKDDLFYNFMLRSIEAVLDVAKSRIEMEATAEGSIKAYILTFFEEIKKYVNLFDILRGEIKESPKLISRVRVYFDNEETRLLSGILKTGVENGEFREFSDPDINLITYTLMTSIRGLLIDLYIHDIHLYNSERMEILVDILFNGIKKK